DDRIDDITDMNVIDGDENVEEEAAAAVADPIEVYSAELEDFLQQVGAANRDVEMADPDAEGYVDMEDDDDDDDDGTGLPPTAAPLPTSLQEFQPDVLDATQLLFFVKFWILIDKPEKLIPTLPAYKDKHNGELAEFEQRCTDLQMSRTWHSRAANSIKRVLERLVDVTAKVALHGAISKNDKRLVEEMLVKLKEAMPKAEQINDLAIQSIQVR
ncbi:hypothetical protein PFISCL1PPCAC_12404, partial [Pristionchus fissidentatus]